MRSHSGNNGKPSQSTSAATLLILQCKLKKFWMLVRQGGEDGPERRTQLLPYATHQHITPVTSYTPHFIWNAVARQELNGIADAFLHVCWLVCHMLRLSFCLRNSTSWDYMTCSCKKNKKWWATVCDAFPYLTSLHVGVGILLTFVTAVGQGRGTPGQRSPSTTVAIMGEWCLACIHTHLNTPPPQWSSSSVVHPWLGKKQQEGTDNKISMVPFHL